MTNGASLRLCSLACTLLLFAAGCATTPAAPPASRYFVDDPVDLLPDLGAALYVNVPRLRAEEALWAHLLERFTAEEDVEADRQRLRRFAEQAETLVVGLGPELGDDPSVLLVIRTRDVPIVSEAGLVLDAPTELGSDGFRRGQIGDDDLVVVDAYTAVIFEAGLRTAMAAVLSKQPGRRFKDEAAYQGLASEVAFGSAPVALLGVLPPRVLEQVNDRVPPAMRPLARAMSTVQYYGGLLDVGDTIDLRLSLRGRSTNDMALLTGALILLKNALVSSNDEPELARMAAKLQVELREQILTLSYAMSRAELLEGVKGLRFDADEVEEEASPPRGEEI